MVQGMASSTINDSEKIIFIESNGTTLDPLGWPLIRVMGPLFGETAYISEVNRATKVKFDVQVATNKNLDPVQKLFP